MPLGRRIEQPIPDERLNTPSGVNMLRAGNPWVDIMERVYRVREDGKASVSYAAGVPGLDTLWMEKKLKEHSDLKITPSINETTRQEVWSITTADGTAVFVTRQRFWSPGDGPYYEVSGDGSVTTRTGADKQREAVSRIAGIIKQQWLDYTNPTIRRA